MPKTTKRVRSRTGYVMVELTPEERAQLEKLRDNLSRALGVRFNLAATFRYLLQRTEYFQVSS